jgi:crotonobetainyl-CoA:carnitine CoA-transferase CaiB-like acyl-CoA transferase
MTEQQNILEGIRVVEVATMILVPATGMMLADYGADVIKIETPGVGDGNRYLHQLTGMPVSEIPYCYLQDNRNKRSVALDLKSEEGLAILRQLLETADVFTSNVRPQALERLGLTYEEVQAINPGIIYAYANGYGEAGPEATSPGYDVICYWSRSGLEATLFPYEGWLSPIPAGSGDHPTGVALFGAIMLALYDRQRSGRGRKVTTSLIASGTYANSSNVQGQLCGAEFPERVHRDESHNFAYIYYRAGDGQVFKPAIVNVEKRWPSFCRAMGRPDLIDDPRFANNDIRIQHMTELIAIFDEVIAQHDLEYWKAALREHDIPFAVPSDYEAVENDPQLAANGVFIEVDDPRYGKMRMVDSPIKLQGIDKVGPNAAPDLGQHSQEVLGELGYTEKQIEDLLGRGVISEGQGG